MSDDTLALLNALAIFGWVVAASTAIALDRDLFALICLGIVGSLGIWACIKRTKGTS
jgi:hypothetical protein